MNVLQLRPLRRDVEGDALAGALQEDAPKEEHNQHSVGEEGGEVGGLVRRIKNEKKK